MIQVEVGKPFIAGLYGCSCHSFSSWKECYKFQSQRMKIGETVKHRCSGVIGIVTELGEHGYVTIKNGDLPRDIRSEHVQNLIKVPQDVKIKSEGSKV